MMLLVAGLTAIISVNGSVAALLPVVVVLATRTGRPASLLLIPLVYAAFGGSLLALTGSPVNVLMSNASMDAGGAPFGYFEFAFVGVPLLLGTMVIVVLLGDRLLPVRTPLTFSPDLSRHARTLARQYGIEAASAAGEGGGTAADRPPILDRESGVVEV